MFQWLRIADAREALNSANQLLKHLHGADAAKELQATCSVGAVSTALKAAMGSIKVD
ncbi:hypothetical protein [Pseudolysobacter antarcticus]|uniref:hypothetical protein n=1 Tax=Pseudolysobacter antarcticus TaxID=2511995 RepID=UPI0013EADCF4|nr:hypothetical protein [Pseudolysobacter antarcticus]